MQPIKSEALIGGFLIQQGAHVFPLLAQITAISLFFIVQPKFYATLYFYNKQNKFHVLFSLY
jgi:hypothetical protein